MGYLRRQLVVSALAANAVHPPRHVATSIPSMFAGWMVSELAPHVMLGTAVDTALELAHPKGRRTRALLGLANLAALGYVARQGRLSSAAFSQGLSEALGEESLSELSTRYADLDWTTPLRQLAWPFSIPSEGIEVIKNISYAPQYGTRGLLDVYKPAGDVTGAPVLLQVHGGGWTIGNKDQQGIPLMKHMASRGWVCVAVNYRLSPRDAFPAHLVDVKHAIAWIRQHGAEYGADPAYIAITGGSAGGHLTALAALTPNDPEYQPGFEDADTTVQAAVPFYGVYDMAGITGGAAVWMRDRFLGPRVFFSDPSKDLTPFEKASPLLRVNADAPPFYVIHGVNDSLVPVVQARRFVAALRAVSHEPVAYTELAGTQHAFDVFPSARSQNSVRGVERFLRWSHDAWKARRAGVPEPAVPAAEHLEAGHPDATGSSVG